MRTRHLRGTGMVAALAATGLLVLASCGGSSNSASGDNGSEMSMVFPLAAPAFADPVAVYAVARQKGYFKDEGLTVEPIFQSGGSGGAVQVVAANSGTVADADIATALAAQSNGTPIVFFAKMLTKFVYQMAVPADSELSSFEDLSGKKIGVVALSSGSAQFASVAMSLAGVEPSEYTLVPVGVGAPALAALQDGQVDALALFPTIYRAYEGAGQKFNYFENDPYFDKIPLTGFAANPSIMKSDPALLEHFGRAAFRAIQYSIANPEEAVEIGYEVFPDLKPTADYDAKFQADVTTMRTWLESVTPPEGSDPKTYVWGEVTTEELETLGDYVVRTGQVEGTPDVKNIYDGSLLESINDFERTATP